MVELQPRLPGRKGRPKEGAHPGQPGEGKRPEERRRQETPGQQPRKRPMEDKKLLIGIVIVMGIVAFVLIYLWLYPPQQPGPPNALRDSQVRAELERLKWMNAYPDNLDIRPQDYPKVLGSYRNQTLEEIYFCSDVCPDYGRVYLVYRGVQPEECAGAGGRAVHDLAWGGYIGCEPKVSG